MTNYNILLASCQTLAAEEQAFLSFIGKITDKKMKSRMLAALYRAIGYTEMGGDSYLVRADRVEKCGDFLQFAAPENGGKKRLINANFCRDRLCPSCNWRKSLKTFGQVSKCLNFLKNDFRFIFLTLTIPDVPEKSLDVTMDKLFDAWGRLAKRKQYKKAVKGAFRALEVTVKSSGDPDVGDLYHPHFHCILAVNRSYFTDTRYYLNHADWTALWCDCCKSAGIDVPVVKNPKTGEMQPFLSVDVRRIRARKTAEKSETSEAAAASEVAKYALKDAEYLGEGISDIDRAARVFFLSLALKKRRLISFSGCFAKARKALLLDDPETGDLTEKSEISEDVWYIVEKFGWRGVGYVPENVERMSGAQIRQLKVDRAEEAKKSQQEGAAAQRKRGREAMQKATLLKNERRRASIEAARHVTYGELRRRFHHSD